jgi:methylmalonyl-CoA mutase N-terminal domain/subunit
VVVGVNKYRVDQPDPPLETHKLDDDTVRRQVERLRQTKANRDPKAVAGTLAALEMAARDPSVNLVPPLMDCVRSMVTVGEMIQTMERVFGQFKEPAAI